MNIDSIIRDVQRHYNLVVDGKAGIQTWTAIHGGIFGEQGRAEDVMDVAMEEKVDARSEKNIDTLHDKVKPYARALILKAKQKGWNFKITSALRTFEEQDALFAQGRTKPGKIVTNARSGASNHNYGTAFDVTLFNGSQPVWNSPLYKALGAIGEEIGLEWGGNWKSIKDEPHFQLRPHWAAGMSESQMLAELRRRRSTGHDYFA